MAATEPIRSKQQLKALGEYFLHRGEPRNYAKVVFDTDFRILQYIRLKGDTEWRHSLEAKVGDEVEIQFEYRNLDKRENLHEDVMVASLLPAALEYIPGSTVLYNSNHPNGLSVNEDTIATTGINIGDYRIGANAYIRFSVKVTDTDLDVGSNNLVNWTSTMPT